METKDGRRGAEGEEWSRCLEVDLKMPDMDMENTSAEELVERWELLRNIWLQLAQGLQ
jgi:hypothetical protein